MEGTGLAVHCVHSHEVEVNAGVQLAFCFIYVLDCSLRSSATHR